MKKLNEIIKCSYDVLISGIVDDSRDVKPGYLFVATKGYNVDHYDFIDMAIKNGASALVVDRKYNTDIPQVVVKNINSMYSKLCEKFYDVKLSEFNFIGITGTDGKTTTATIVQKILNDSFPVAYIGTNGCYVNGQNYPTHNTTPCISELYKCLSIIKSKHCKEVVIEISSEAILHNRIEGFKFDIVAFTNITEDHLNIHGTIENYRDCKFKLVNYLKKNGIVIINGDDDNCSLLKCNNLYTFGFNNCNDYVIHDESVCKDSVKFKFNVNKVDYDVYSNLVGHYNVYNIALALLIGMFKKVPIDLLISRVSKINSIIGRGERLDFGQKFTIILDYAHTYNAIKNLLANFTCRGRIIVVTGAAGGREKEKRANIGKLILEKADYAIFTMDDPRCESVDSIIDDLVSSSDKKNYCRINSREDAISKAFSMAKEDDIVLIIGKGRDNYMAIGNEKIPYCDYEVISNYFLNK